MAGAAWAQPRTGPVAGGGGMLAVARTGCRWRSSPAGPGRGRGCGRRPVVGRATGRGHRLSPRRTKRRVWWRVGSSGGRRPWWSTAVWPWGVEGRGDVPPLRPVASTVGRCGCELHTAAHLAAVRPPATRPRERVCPAMLPGSADRHPHHRERSGPGSEPARPRGQPDGSQALRPPVEVEDRRCVGRDTAVRYPGPGSPAREPRRAERAGLPATPAPAGYMRTRWFHAHSGHTSTT